MGLHLMLFSVWSCLIRISVCQAPQRPTPNRINPFTMLAGDVRLCGDTLMRQNSANRPIFQPARLPPMQVQSHIFQSPVFVRQPQAIGIPFQQQQAVFGIQGTGPFIRRMKRQAQQPGYQPAFVPNLSHLQPNQASFPPQQTYQQQQQFQPGLSPQQRFLAPNRYQQTGIHNLLQVLDPPDRPDVPDIPFGVTPVPPHLRGGSFARAGQAIPRPGPQVNKPMANPGNPPAAQGLPPRPAIPQAQQIFSPPRNTPMAQGGFLSPQQIRNIAAMPIMNGIDTVCFCTDSATCLFIQEGNVEYGFANQCAAATPPNIRPSGIGEICCCLG